MRNIAKQTSNTQPHTNIVNKRNESKRTRTMHKNGKIEQHKKHTKHFKNTWKKQESDPCQHHQQSQRDKSVKQTLQNKTNNDQLNARPINNNTKQRYKHCKQANSTRTHANISNTCNGKKGIQSNIKATIIKHAPRSTKATEGMHNKKTK